MPISQSIFQSSRLPSSLHFGSSGSAILGSPASSYLFYVPDPENRQAPAPIPVGKGPAVLPDPSGRRPHAMQPPSRCGIDGHSGQGRAPNNSGKLQCADARSPRPIFPLAWAKTNRSCSVDMKTVNWKFVRVRADALLTVASKPSRGAKQSGSHISLRTGNGSLFIEITMSSRLRLQRRQPVAQFQQRFLRGEKILETNVAHPRIRPVESAV